MNSRNRDDAYRAASDAAQVELNDILNEIEQLQLRRAQIEKVSAALRPLIELDQQLAPGNQRATYPPFEPDHQAVPRVLPALGSAAVV